MIYRLLSLVSVRIVRFDVSYKKPPVYFIMIMIRMTPFKAIHVSWSSRDVIYTTFHCFGDTLDKLFCWPVANGGTLNQGGSVHYSNKLVM